MRIVQINAVYRCYSTGVSTAEMHEYFKNHNIDSYVFYGEKKQKTNDSNVIYLGNLFNHKFAALFGRITGKRYRYNNCATKKIIEAIETINPDCVILANVHSNFINIYRVLEYLKKTNKKTILHLDDCFYFTGGCTHYINNNCMSWTNKCKKCQYYKEIFNSFKNGADWEFKKKQYAYMDFKHLGVVGVSKWVSDECKKSRLLGGVTTTYVYNWIDFDKFYKKENIIIQGFKCSLFYILGVSAKWSNAKGFNYYIGLADLLKDDEKIILVGKCEQKLKTNKIIYVGAIDDITKLADYYNLADVTLQLSTMETFGKIVAESLACGTPVITNKYTANPELVNEKCGIILKDLNYFSIYDAIQRVRNNKHLYTLENCINRAKNLFDKSINIKKTLDFIEKI